MKRTVALLLEAGPVGSSSSQAARAADDASRTSARLRSCMLLPPCHWCSTAARSQQLAERKARGVADPGSGGAMTSVKFSPATKATLPTSSSTVFDPAIVTVTRWLMVVLTPKKLELVPAVTAAAAGTATESAAPGAVT